MSLVCVTKYYRIWILWVILPLLVVVRCDRRNGNCSTTAFTSALFGYVSRSFKMGRINGIFSVLILHVLSFLFFVFCCATGNGIIRWRNNKPKQFDFDAGDERTCLLWIKNNWENFLYFPLFLSFWLLSIYQKQNRKIYSSEFCFCYSYISYVLRATCCHFMWENKR